MRHDVSLSRFLALFSDILWEPGKHKGSCVSFVLEIEEIMNSHGLSEFNDDLIDFLVKEFRRRNNKNATINRKLSALYKLLRKAERNGVIKRVPAYVRLPEKNGRIRFFTTEEEHRFFNAMRERSEANYRLCVFLIDTGARIGEARGLKWNDVTDTKATFWITKSGRSRTVPLTLRAAKAAAKGKSTAGPFADIEYPKFLYDWNAVKKAVGLDSDKQVVPHILRHTCASRLVQSGIDLRRVQSFLGHQTIQMTLRYAHLATDDLDQCVIALEKYRSKNPREAAFA
ncbi:tyrosine-type recombinase/integrase [Oricola sp.]|uniref:tyrosine-type recombinase/integrase n=1 Tax=Oricola sp. TaxID=1979950 RepID=UPI003BA97CFD